MDQSKDDKWSHKLFSNFPLKPTVKEIIRLSNSEHRWTSKANVWSEKCNFVHQFDSRCRAQTEDIKTCSISPALPCPDRVLPVPNHKRTKRVGDDNCGITVITLALRILQLKPFFFLTCYCYCHSAFYRLEWKFGGVQGIKTAECVCRLGILLI